MVGTVGVPPHGRRGDIRRPRTFACLLAVLALMFTPARAAEQSFHALQFDSADHAFLETAPFAFGGTRAMTYAAWIRLTDTGSHNFGSMYEDSGHIDSAFTVRAEGRRIRFFTSDGEGAFFETASGSALVEPDTWTHVAVTHEPGRQRIYLDGALVHETRHDHTMNAVEYPLQVGRDGRGRHHFHGKIDDVRLYSRALSTREIQALYALKHHADVTDNLVIWLPLNDGTGNTAQDASTHARHATISRARWVQADAPRRLPTLALHAAEQQREGTVTLQGEITGLGDVEAVTAFFRWREQRPAEPVTHVNESSFRDGRQIVLDGDYSYVAGGHNTDGLGVFNIADPARPLFIALAGEVTRIGHGAAKKGRHVFISGRVSGTVEVFDVSDPLRPTAVGYIQNDDYQGILGLHIVDETLYAGLAGDHDPAVADNPTGFIAFDISDPRNIRQTYFQTEGVGSLQYPVSDEQGRYLYVSAYRDDELAVFDITDRNAPVHVLSTSFSGYGNGRGIEIDGDVLYLADQRGTLLSIDISDRERPVPRDSLTHAVMAGAREIRLDRERQVMYVAGRSSRAVAVIDVSDPSDLTHVGSITHPTFDNPYGLALDAEAGILHVSNADHREGIYQLVRLDSALGSWNQTTPETITEPQRLVHDIALPEPGASYEYKMVIRYGDSERAGAIRTIEITTEP